MIAHRYWKSIAESQLSEAQILNRDLLRCLLEGSDGKLKVFESSSALKILNEFSVKKVKSACKFSGVLELGPPTRLPVRIFARSAKATMPPTKNVSTDGHAIKRERIFFAPDDPAMRPLP